MYMSSRGKKNTHTLGIPTKGSCSEENKNRTFGLKNTQNFLTQLTYFTSFIGRLTLTKFTLL